MCYIVLGTLSKYSSVAQVEIIVICILSSLVRLSSLRNKKVLRASCHVDIVDGFRQIQDVHKKIYINVKLKQECAKAKKEVFKYNTTTLMPLYLSLSILEIAKFNIMHHDKGYIKWIKSIKDNLNQINKR